MKPESQGSLIARVRSQIYREGDQVPIQSKVCLSSSSMGVFDAVSTNIAVREFRSEAIRENQLLRILKSAQLCQSAKNLQAWHFILVRSKALLSEIADLMKGDVDEEIVRNAPVAIAIVADPSNEFHIVDAARAAQNMNLVAWEMGIGSCWISGLEPPDREKCRYNVKQILLVPASLELVDLMVFGYPRHPRIVRWKNRKRLRDITSQERFGNSLILEEESPK